jgi:hypothetical protein
VSYAALGDDSTTMGALPFDEEVYWARDLRLGRYEQHVPLLDDPSTRLAWVCKAFRNKRVLRILARTIEVSEKGSVKQIQCRVSQDATQAVRFLLVAAFAAYKVPAAVSDIAEAVLGQDELEECRLDSGSYDRLGLLLYLYLRDPQALVRVRGLNSWHRKGAAAMVLAEEPPRPREPLEDFMTEARVTEALEGLNLGPSAPPLIFEMVIPRVDESHLLFLRRGHRPTHNWSFDGQRIHHGLDEELIILRFHDHARRVLISSTTSELPRRVADRLASAYFGESCRYQDDQPEVEHRQVENLLGSITDPDDGRLPVVELLVDNAPLAGRKKLMISEDGDGDIIEAIDDFEARVGNLLDDPDDIARIKVRFQGRRVSLFFPKRQGIRCVEYGDGRLDNNRCLAFETFMRSAFGIVVRSTERKGGR